MVFYLFLQNRLKNRDMLSNAKVHKHYQRHSLSHTKYAILWLKIGSMYP